MEMNSKYSKPKEEIKTIVDEDFVLEFDELP